MRTWQRPRARLSVSPAELQWDHCDGATPLPRPCPCLLAGCPLDLGQGLSSGAAVPEPFRGRGRKALLASVLVTPRWCPVPTHLSPAPRPCCAKVHRELQGTCQGRSPSRQLKLRSAGDRSQSEGCSLLCALGLPLPWGRLSTSAVAGHLDILPSPGQVFPCFRWASCLSLLYFLGTANVSSQAAFSSLDLTSSILPLLSLLSCFMDSVEDTFTYSKVLFVALDFFSPESFVPLLTFRFTTCLVLGSVCGEGEVSRQIFPHAVDPAPFWPRRLVHCPESGPTGVAFLGVSVDFLSITEPAPAHLTDRHVGPSVPEIQVGLGSGIH